MAQDAVTPYPKMAPIDPTQFVIPVQQWSDGTEVR
jgi:hypothetical protein